jgi:hypothetical protein
MYLVVTGQVLKPLIYNFSIILIIAEVLVCSIAKIKTTDWEELLSALPLAHGGTEGKQDDEVKEDIPNTSKNLTDVKSFRGRSTQFTS